MGLVRTWINRHFSDPQVVGLAIVLVACFVIIYSTGDMLAPVLASVVIAYLLEGLVGAIERSRVPRLASVLLVFCGFMVLLRWGCSRATT